MKDRKDTSDKEKDKDNYKFNDTSKSDTKDDNFKNKEKDKAIIKIVSDEKKESKWDNIDWSKKKSDKGKENKWDTIDWSKRRTDEEKESKWDTIDWSKKRSDEEKESKWDTIDWSKKRSDEERESKWDTIDWNKSRTDNEKIEENKYENTIDKSMNGEEFKEDIEDFNKKEVDNDFIQESNKESDDKDDDLSWLKDYDENSEDNELEDLSWLKDYDENSKDNELDDLNKDFMEDIEHKSRFSDINLDFIEGIEHKLEESDIDRDDGQVYTEENQDIPLNEKNKNLENIKECNYKDNQENLNLTYNSLTNPLIQNKFKEYIDEKGKYPNYGTNIRKDFYDWIDEKTKNPNITVEEKEFLNNIKNICNDINENQQIQKFIIDKIKNSNLEQQQISKIGEDIGVKITRKKIVQIAQEIVFSDNKRDYYDRFPKFSEKLDYSLRDQNFSENDWKHLKVKGLKEILNEYSNETGKKPNRGTRLLKSFKEWIDQKINNTKNDNVKRELMNLRDICNTINNNNEIGKFIIDRIKNSNNNQNDIVYEAKQLGIEFDRDVVKKYASELVYYKNIEDYHNRFPIYVQKQLDLISLRNQRVTEKDWEHLRTQGLKNMFEKYRIETNQEPNMGRRITKGFIKWLNENTKNIEKENITDKEKESIKLLGKICKEINKKQEIEKLIIDRIQNTNDSLREIAKNMAELGVNNSIQIVKKMAKEVVFYNNEREYNNRFPAHDEISEEIRAKVINDIINTNLPVIKIADLRGVAYGTVRNISKYEIREIDPNYDHETRFPIDLSNTIGTETHKGINKIITKHFKENFNVLYVSEPKIYPNSNRGPDGFIPNDNNFLQERLNDPNNEFDLTIELFNIDKNNNNRDEILEKLSNRIKGIIFDYTNDVSDKNMIRKCLKYEAPELMLFIVGTQWYKYSETRELPKNHPDFVKVKYPDNVKIISHDLFLDFIRLKGNNKDNFQNIMKANYLQDLDKITKFSSSQILESYNTEDLRQYYIIKGYIKKDFDEYFNGIERMQELKSNSKQEIIDKYL